MSREKDDNNNVVSFLKQQQQQHDNNINDDNTATSARSGFRLFHWNDHLKSTCALCLCVASMSYMIISVFPYSGFMAIQLIDGVTEETAGTYAGLLSSSFLIGRAMTSYSWGKWADLYGRKLILQTSLALSTVFMLLFGLSTSFGMALTTRFGMGFVNGIMTIAKTAVSELASGNVQKEKRGMGLVVGMWGWGFLWGPALGGFLAEPATQYPNSNLVRSKLVGPLLTKFPFLLPNLVGVCMCCITMVAVQAWVPETLPPERRRSARKIPSDAWKWTRRMQKKFWQKCCSEQGTEEEHVHFATQEINNMDQVEHEEESSTPTSWTPDNLKEIRMQHSESGTMLSTQVTTISPRPSVIHVRSSVAKRISRISEDLSSAAAEQRRSSIVDSSGPSLSSIWNRVDTRMQLILYWVFGFVQICMDEAFPLYCISKEGGLGLTEGKIGQILSLSGILFGVCQYFVYANIVNRVGLYESLQIGSLCLPIVVLIPFSVFLNNPDGTTNWKSILYLCTILATSRVIASVYYSSIFISLNRTVPASERATMNGLQTLGGSICKGIGPTFAGILVAFCFSSIPFSPRVGGFVIWMVIGTMGILNTMAITLLFKEEAVLDDTAAAGDCMEEGGGGGSIETEKLSKG